jgi:hypothetical protein
MKVWTPLLAGTTFIAITVTAFAIGSETTDRTDETLGWTEFAQETAPEKLKLERRGKHRRAHKDDDEVDDDDTHDVDDGGKRRRICPAGERPTPRRGRGGDFGGCI